MLTDKACNLLEFIHDLAMNYRGNLLAIAIVTGMLSLSFSCSPVIPKYKFKYAEKRAVLPNGLKLVVIPDTATQLVQVDVRYEVGSNEDPEGKRRAKWVRGACQT